jgi:hypothetical protein
MAKESELIYEKFISVAHDNFRKSLDSSQKGLRAGIGKKTASTLASAFSERSRISAVTKNRRQKLSRGFIIRSIQASLRDWGPKLLDSSKPLENIQPDGGVGYWFSFSRPLPSAEYQIKAGGEKIHLHLSNDKTLLTTSLPQRFFQRSGELQLKIAVVFEWEISSQAQDQEVSIGIVKIQ